MRSVTTSAGWALAALLGVALLATWAGVIQAGPLDPPGPVGPTMKSLDDLAPSWHRTLSAAGGCSSQRFACVLGGDGVLDRETGLVWERVPDGNTMSWDSAVRACQWAYHGGRLGWRLPTASELMTLGDTAEVSSGLPSGHPFTVGTNDAFWTSTQDAASPSTRAIKYDFDIFLTSDELKGSGYRAWCVRAPAGPDLQ
jgi:hypothetical protein